MEFPLSIEAVARRTGLTPDTLRYYERIGLIAPIARASGGQRRYAAADIAWIEFLLRLRTTHMPIGKMLAFARLRGAGDSTVSDRRALLEAHLTDVLAEMEAMRLSVAALQDKITHYRSLERSPVPVSQSAGAPPHEHTDLEPLRTRAGQTARD